MSESAVTLPAKRYLGRCKRCKRGIQATTPLVPCPDCGRPSWLVEVDGNYVSNIKCGAKCQNAVGPACDCSCGGANHGCNH